jgi:ribosome-associated translation inhibitor RaiA
MSTTDAFIIKHYTILTSFSHRSIYIKLTDTIGYIHYEAYLDSSDFHIALPIESVYQLITNCFAEDTGYNVNISVSGKTMTIRFHAQINGFIMFDFPVHIKEKLITTDGQLTLSFNRIEERQLQVERKTDKLVEDVNISLKNVVDEYRKVYADTQNVVETRCNNVQAIVDERCNNVQAIVDERCNNVQAIVDERCANIEVSINKWCADVQAIVDIRCNNVQAIVDEQCANTILHLENTINNLESRIKKLESLILNSEIDIRMNTTFVSLSATSITTPADNYLKFDKLYLFENLQQLHFIPITLCDLSKCHFPHLKELYLDGGGKTHFRSLLGISGMPNLEHISIINAPGLTAVNTILPPNHKIKSIHVKDCPGINMDGLSIYCRVNHIQLVKT